MTLKTKEEYLAFMLAGAFAQGLCEMESDSEKFYAMFPEEKYFDPTDKELLEKIAIKFMIKYVNVVPNIVETLEQFDQPKNND